MVCEQELLQLKVTHVMSALQSSGNHILINHHLSSQHAVVHTNQIGVQKSHRQTTIKLRAAHSLCGQRSRLI